MSKVYAMHTRQSDNDVAELKFIYLILQIETTFLLILTFRYFDNLFRDELVYHFSDSICCVFLNEKKNGKHGRSK